MCQQYLTKQGRYFYFRETDLIRLEISSFINLFQVIKKCKLVKSGEWNLDQKGILVDIKSTLIVTVSHGNDTSVEELGKKAANKIVDGKLHSKDVLEELKRKIISWQLVDSDNEDFMKLCQILQN